MIKINTILFILLIIILIIINFVNNDKKFKINLLIENNINKILLSICILFLVIEDVKLGALLFAESKSHCLLHQAYQADWGTWSSPSRVH